MTFKWNVVLFAYDFSQVDHKSFMNSYVCVQSHDFCMTLYWFIFSRIKLQPPIWNQELVGFIMYLHE